MKPVKPISKEEYIKRRTKSDDRELLEYARDKYCLEVQCNAELRKEAVIDYMKNFCKYVLIREINKVTDYDILIKIHEGVTRVSCCSLEVTNLYMYSSEKIKKDLKKIGIERYLRYVTFSFSDGELADTLQELLDELYPYLKLKVSIECYGTGRFLMISKNFI